MPTSADPAQVGHALAELAAAAARNIGARARTPCTAARRGMTPNPPPDGMRSPGDSRTDGSQEQVAVFARGTRVFQATVVGAKLDVQTVETFFGTLRLPA